MNTLKNSFEAVSRILPQARWGEPLTEQEIKQAEDDAGIKVPLCVRHLYLHGNGLREPMGNTSYLIPLVDAGGEGTGEGTIFTLTEALRNDFPKFITKQVCWGMTGGGEYWLSNEDDSETVYLWSWREPELFEPLGDDVAAIFKHDQDLFSELE